MYQHFLKALKGSFENFVQSNEVNTYLQTIGGEIKTEILQDGILYEFIVISGYEEERGNWATAYNNQIRFGNEVISAQGLDQLMILTPNLFYGKNQKGEEIEYRVGLIKTESKLRVLPVVLKKAKDDNTVQAQILSDLCVIHRGVSIDPKTAQQLDREQIAELTAYQKFITCFWNLDDYLRKQNLNFFSDYDIDIWQAVEVFSGRIIDQMLGKISEYFISNRLTSNPNWIISQAEIFYQQKLILWIERCLDEGNEISENQIIYLVKNLCSYMCRFQNFRPLEILAKKGLNILPYIMKNFKNPRTEITNEAFRAFKLSFKFPQLIDRNLINNILELIQDYNLSQFAFETYESIMERTSQFIDVSLTIILPMLSDPHEYRRVVALKAYKLTLAKAPQNILPKGIYKIVELLSDQHERVRFAALDAYKIASKKNPNLIAQYLPVIFKMFLNECIDLKKVALEAYEVTLTRTLTRSHQFISETLPIIIKMISNKKKNTRKIALKAYITTIIKAPELINQNGINKILEMLLDQYSDIRTAALEAYATISLKTPQFISKTIPKLIEMLSDEHWDIRIVALKTYAIALTNAPHLNNQYGMGLILNFFSDPNENVRKAALDTYRIAVIRDPNLMNQRGTNRIITLFSDKTVKIRIAALNTYTIVLAKATQFVDKNGINDILELFSDPNENVRKAALYTYRTALIQVPKYIDQIGINTLIEMLTDQYWDVKIVAINVYTTALKEIPQFIPNTLPKLLEMLSDQNWDIKVATLKAYTTVLAKIPQYINQKQINKLLEMFSSQNKFVREAALEAYKIAIAKIPKFINQNGINKLILMFSDKDPLVKQAAHNTYEIAQIKIPQLVPPQQDSNT
ncbi:MAG: hypothetical protein ACFFD2_05105 [Promethearchaeota archaeon]